MSQQTLRNIIKWNNIGQGQKHKLKDGRDAFYVHMRADGHESFLVHVLFNHKDYGFNNIFKESVPLLEVQSLYRQCLIDVNSSGSCMFIYRGISFSLKIHTASIWCNQNGTITSHGDTCIGSFMMAGQFTE